MSQVLYCQCKCGCDKITKQLVNNRCKNCDKSNHLNTKTGLRFQVGIPTRRSLKY